MDKLLKFLKKRPHATMTAPAILCATVFVIDFFHAMSDGNIDNAELNTLQLTVDGFATIVLALAYACAKNRYK